MIKDRFGGLFSSLNKRDIQTLTEFERFLNIAIEQNILVENEPHLPYTWEPGDPIISDRYESDPGVPGEFTSRSTENIYEYFKNLYEDLYRVCQVDEEEDYLYSHLPGETIEMKRQCRWWLAKVRPVLTKLKKLVYRNQNEELR